MLVNAVSLALSRLFCANKGITAFSQLANTKLFNNIYLIFAGGLATALHASRSHQNIKAP
jgi:hypothetical protein